MLAFSIFLASINQHLQFSDRNKIIGEESKLWESSFYNVPLFRCPIYRVREQGSFIA
jgi:hypothetical protein